MVLYNGAEKYTAPFNFWELFDNPELAKDLMAGDYNLIDLQAMDDDDINYDEHLSFFLYVLKHIKDRNSIKMLETALKLCVKAITIDKGKDYIHTRLIIWYIESKVSIEKRQFIEQLIIDNLPKEDTRNIMKTIADGYRDEAATNIATNMLKERLDLSLIASVTGISSDKLLKLKSNTNGV